MQKSTNPLASHFRQPAIYLKLPSGGRYWAPGSLNLPANGEIGVMPMTTKDEILLRTPDALMNGDGVVKVIDSCCPNITNAWGMPTIDADSILIAIRIATYGSAMDIDSSCPKCNHENRHQIPLNDVLMRVRAPDYSPVLNIDGLQIRFKPINYLQSTKNNIIDFENQKLAEVILNENLDEETKKAQFDVHVQKIVDASTNILVMGTASITTENGDLVTEPEYIHEFYTNTTNKNINLIKDKLQSINEVANLPPVKVQCEGCESEYSVGVTFDYANFFGPPS